MKLRWTGATAFDVAAPSACAVCGTRKVPYLPRCSACGAPSPKGGGLGPSPSAEKAPDTTRVAHLTDLHVGKSDERRAHVEGWLGELARVGVDVVVVSGDLVERARDDGGLATVARLLARAGMASVVVPGNHDVERPGERPAFDRHFSGAYPRVETHNGVDFLLVDSTAGLPRDERGGAERAFAKFFCWTEGRVGQPALDSLARSLEGRSPRPRVLVLHHHLVHQPAELVPHPSVGVRESVIGTMRALHDAAVVRSFCERHRVQLVLHGHKHAMTRAGVQSGRILVLNGGSSTQATAGGTVRARVVDVPLDASGAMRVHEAALC